MERTRAKTERLEGVEAAIIEAKRWFEAEEFVRMEAERQATA